jgi:hypothetical protein
MPRVAPAVNSQFFILDEAGEVIPVDLSTWAAWLETHDGRIAETLIPGPYGARISTVFLGLDHRLDRDSDLPPLLFETMIFGGEEDGSAWRTSTRAEALACHNLVVKQFAGRG